MEEKLKRGVVPNPTELMDPMTRHLDLARTRWGNYEDLEWNPVQRHREDIPRQEAAYDQHQALRDVVDDLMRMEIERLQAALNRDRGKYFFYKTSSELNTVLLLFPECNVVITLPRIRPSQPTAR